MSEGELRRALVLLGASQLALGAWQAVSPSTFFHALGGFGLLNDHFIRDVSTFYLALGIALLVAASRPSWRTPILFFGAVEYGLHLVNHLIDISRATPGWIGPADVVALAAVEAAFLALLGQSGRARHRARADRPG